MGRRKRGYNFKKNRDQQWQSDETRGDPRNNQEGYTLVEKSNKMLEKYYQGIGIVSEEEMPQFLEACRQPLPTTFRITGSRSQAKILLNIIRGKYFSSLVDAEKVCGIKVEPKCLTWYPDELAWQLDLTKKEIRQSETLTKLHQFLISETETGNISRQEAVSMLPPILLDIKPHHKILDLCAAPGSKTAQLIEYLHSDETVAVPDGFVVANDSDNKRCYLMTHQVKRIQSPNCMIINHDARILPNIQRTHEDPKQRVVKFDRILCDVPCSGDGTIRKNPDIWAKWNTSTGNSLHKLQQSILRRGLELLTVGGRLIYSTCSMNPVEDEAVVLRLLNKSAGAVELVDVSDKLENLKYLKGTYSWKVMDRDGVFYERKDQVPQPARKAWEDSIYPPLLPEAQAAKLERCVRVLPHFQNTGGFFLAVMEKKAELPWHLAPTPVPNPQSTKTVEVKVTLDEATPTADTSAMDANDNQNASVAMETAEAATEQTEGQVEMKNDAAEKETNSAVETTDGTAETAENDVSMETGKDETEKADETSTVPDESGASAAQEESTAARNAETGEPAPKRPKKIKLHGYKEDPFIFCQKGDPIWSPIKKFFDISDSFNFEQMMYRNKKRILYLVSNNVRDLVQRNHKKIKFINLGVKCFSNAPSPLVPDCDFRLSQEGILCIEPHINTRRIHINKQDVITILGEENPFIYKLSKSAQEDVYSYDPGSVLFLFNPSESDPEPNCTIIFCGWRGKTSVRSFVNKDERSHYLRLCGVELLDIQERVAAEKAAKALAMLTEGTPDSMGATSGDEEQVKKWNEVEAVRFTEEEECGSDVDKLSAKAAPKKPSNTVFVTMEIGGVSFGPGGGAATCGADKGGNSVTENQTVEDGGDEEDDVKSSGGQNIEETGSSDAVKVDQVEETLEEPGSDGIK